MRSLSPAAAAALSMLSASQGLAARPDSVAECTTFAIVETVEGRAWEVRGIVCRTPGKPAWVEITDRRETEPAKALKQRLIW